MERLRYIVNILIVATLLATVAVMKDGRIAGEEVAERFNKEAKEEVSEPIERIESNGTRVINSSSIAKDVIGFGGRTPVDVYVKDDKIEKVVFLKNAETPSFFDQVVRSGLADKWNGLTLAEAATKKIDGVTGATYTSEALIENVQLTAQYVANVASEAKNPFAGITLKDIAGILVLLMGVVLTLIHNKNKILMDIQLVLNVVVLGFWCGSFLSLTTLTSWMANGINLSMSIVAFAMLLIVIVMPFMNRKGSYCHIHCPMGAAQELLGRLPIPRIKIKPSLAKFLNNLRYYILITLLFIMWLGVGFDLMNYEIFSAFIFESASNVVLTMAGIFLILSLFIQRPYCRFICPTGALITMSQKTK